MCSYSMEEAAKVRRIRLIFEDQNLLSRRQRSEGLKQCWMIVKPHLNTIADIAVDISFAFQLHRSCPHGVLLSMEGFTLPSSQPTCILKDKDIVSVNKKRDASEKDVLTIEGLDSIKGSETVGEKLPGFGGVKLLAIDEFEKEAGGYQSEHEDDGTISGDGGGSQMENFLISKDFSRKKRKRSERVQCSKGKNSMDENHSNFLLVAPEAGNDKHIHRKRRKERPYKGVQCDTLEDQNDINFIEMVNKDAEDHGTLKSKEHKSKKKIKNKEAKCLKVLEESEEFLQNNMAERCPERWKNSMDENHGNFLPVVPEAGDDKHIHKRCRKEWPYKEVQCDTLEDQNDTTAIEMVNKDGEDHGTLKSKKHKSKKKIKDKEAKCFKVHEESDKFLENNMAERFPEREYDGFQELISEMKNASEPYQVEEKSTSRSAKRKRARRRWLREQKAKNQELVQRNSTLDNQCFSNHENLQKSNQDDDAEAEEESLPVVVRPGHIRFEPIENEQERQGIEDSMPALHWNGITNKRQGQNWGKERNSFHKGEGPACPREKEIISSHSGDERTFNRCPLEFDKLPSMLGVPQEGDIIAYRLVELSTSWCPELSSFRVGAVAWYDCQSTKIRLAPVSEYPFVLRNSLDEEEDAEETGMSPYNDDGSLEIDFASLVDVHWVHQQKPTSEPINTGGEKQISGTDTSTRGPVAEEPGAIAVYTNGQRNLKNSADKDTGFPAIEKLATGTHANIEINSKSDIANLPVDTEGNGEIASVWQEINEVFSAKKAELSLKNDQSKVEDIEAEMTKTLKRSRSKGLKEVCQISKQGTVEFPEQGSGSTNQRSFKALKKSALGPTISLLRAQNIL